MLLAFSNVAHQAITNMHRELGSVKSIGTSSLGDESHPSHAPRVALPAAPGRLLPMGVLQGATLELCLLMLAALLITLGSKELAQPDWDLEWLITFPLPLKTLLATRILERTLVNPTGFLALWPFTTLLAWSGGHRGLAPILGLATTLLLLFPVAVIRTLIDTGLRLRLSPPQLRNLQALISITGVLALYLAMSAGMPGNAFFFSWARAVPLWFAWLPAGMVVRVISNAHALTGAAEIGMLLAQVALLTLLGLALLERLLQNGVISSAGREAGRFVPPAAKPSARSVTQWLSAVQRRELRLLSRDRNFLVQTLVLPLLIIGAQFFFNVRGDSLSSLAQHPDRLAAIAFGISAYALAFSAFQTLNAEGQALWILYCVPHALESVLRQKALLWSALAALYPVVILVVFTIASGTLSPQLVGLGAVVLIGVPIYAVIATALGVFGCDPLAQEVQRRVRISYMYLYMLLSSLYVYALYARNFWQCSALIVLAALLALALWQKARDHLPFLLDPTAAPAPQVSLADGLIAAMAFFVLQSFVTFIQLSMRLSLTTKTLLVAFAIAGAVTYSIMRFVYWKAGTAGVPRILGGPLTRSILWGAIGGLAASCVGIAYMYAVIRFHYFTEIHNSNASAHSDFAAALPLLAVVAAPVFEEFIFRGLIFSGLRRSFALEPAVLASAAIFAILHPPVAVVPVFVLGVTTAFVYEKSGTLAAPMLAHALYNATMIALQGLKF